ncbi:MAG TPA: C-terminal binding protein [Conexibacter sp.]|nr:C-terminal binding protein [Conexibacter sp.]
MMSPTTTPTALLTDAETFPFTEEERATLQRAGIELDELAGHDPAELSARAPTADCVFVYHARIDAPLIAQLERCRVIVRCGVGYDKVDVPAARAAGIEVAYVPDSAVEDVADHTLALILACARRLTLADRTVREGQWLTPDAFGPMHRLGSRTLGLFGLGRIASAVARRAQAFGMTVLAHDPFVEQATVPDVRLVDEEALLASADVVSLHVPLSPATQGLIDSRRLSLFKPGAILVNTSRGGLVDEAALLEALSAGRLAGAGLDVFEHQPLDPSSPLLSRSDVVVTPHCAAYSVESLGDLRRRAIDEAIRVLEGAPPLHPVPA